MHLHREQVLPRHQERLYLLDGEGFRVPAARGRGRIVVERQGAGFADIRPGDFAAVDIGDESVLVVHVQEPVRNGLRVGDGEGYSQVERGLVLGSELPRQEGRILLFPVPETARAGQPGHIVEFPQAPVGRRLVEADEITPFIARGHDGPPVIRNIAPILARGEDQPELGGIEDPVRKHPLEGIVRIVGQAIASQVDGGRAGIVQLQPVGEVAIFVLNRGSVRGHELID